MSGLYIHIPFCKSRCIYCDFYSTTQSELKERYIRALCKELEMRKEYLDGEPLETIYFGGGTPSLWRPSDFRQIFDCIHHIYGSTPSREITLEANPDDLTPDYLHELSTLPFNRLSIGIQTFNKETLQLLRRRHTGTQAMHAIKNARLAGFNNISIDLMYGLPGETLAHWKEDLDQAISLQVEHISAYHLTYEKNTPLYKMLQEKRIEEVSEENSLIFFTMLIDRLLEAGYEHYEISNFCLPNRQSHHNSSYWAGIKYIGCGPSAHSYNQKSREWNTPSIETYLKGIESGNREYEIEYLNKATRYNDLIITSIRTSKGLSLIQLEHEFGKDLSEYACQQARKHIKNKDLEIKNDYLKLTPKGIFISDGIMSDLLWVE